MRSLIFSIFDETLLEALGWGIIHSIWQGFLIAVLLFITLYLMKKKSAQFRYYVSFVSLVMLLACSVITIHKAYNYSKEKQELKTNILADPSYLSTYLKQSNFTDEFEKGKSTFLNTLKYSFLRSNIQRHFPWIIGFWLLGLFFYVLRTFSGLLYQRYLRLSKRSDIDQLWHKKMRDLRKRLEIKKTIDIYTSGIINSPVTTGFLKPVILIPAALISGLPPEQIEAIIAHELAHIKRNDYIINILQTLIEILFFFHPGVWYISSQIRNERENACDDIAIALTNNKAAYAKALADTQEYALNHGKFAMTFTPRKNTILQRIKRLNNKLNMKTSTTEKVISGIIVLAAFFFFSFSMDGNYTGFKDGSILETSVPDTAAKPRVIVLKKTVTDSTGEPVKTKQVYKVKEENLDSLLHALELDKIKSHELEKVIEIALTEDDTAISNKICRNITIALSDIDTDTLIHESMKAAEEAYLEACKALEEIEIEHLITEGLCDSIDFNTQVIIKKALSEAEQALDSIDFDILVSTAMDDALLEIENMDIHEVYIKALEDARKDLEDERIHIIKMKKELLEDEDYLKYKEQDLKEKEEKLKAKLQELEEELEEIQKAQKELEKKNERIE